MTAVAADQLPVTGAWVDRLLGDLFPFDRSITGEGTRASLRRVADELPLEIVEVPSGTPVLDWTVPDEWNLRSARLHGPDGTLVADASELNLHVVNYSIPQHAQLDLEELTPRLHSLPDRPHLIPYRTSYYRPEWGFCIAEEVRAGLPAGMYDVAIDTEIGPGSLSYGELFIPVRRVTKCSSPRMCATPRWPTTTSAASPRRRVSAAGSCRTSDASPIACCSSPRPSARSPGSACTATTRRTSAMAWCWPDWVTPALALQAVAAGRLRHRPCHGAPPAWPGNHLDWYPYGYDERQFNSPGFDLPVGRLSRTMHGTYPEYHTSGDDLGFVAADQILAAARVVIELLDVLESDLVPRNLEPYGEPQLGRRQLYRSTGGTMDAKSTEMAYLWLLSMADGSTDLVEIAARAELPLPTLVAAARDLSAAGLLG